MNDYLMIGEVLKPQGLRGECKIKPCAADLSLFETWTRVFLRKKEDWVPVSLSLHRVHEGFVYAVLGGCTSPEDVEKLRGEKLYIDRAHAAPLEEGAEYIVDLIGCLAVDESGHELGTLSDVLQHGPVDVWVFEGDRPFMAPALRDVFPRVDVAEKRILVSSSRLEEVAVFED